MNRRGFLIQDCREGPQEKFIWASEIPVGTVFEARVDSTREETIYLRIVGGVVDLRDVRHHWPWREVGRGCLRGPRVFNYRPVHGRIIIERNA